MNRKVYKISITAVIVIAVLLLVRFFVMAPFYVSDNNSKKHSLLPPKSIAFVSLINKNLKNNDLLVYKLNAEDALALGKLLAYPGEHFSSKKGDTITVPSTGHEVKLQKMDQELIKSLVAQELSIFPAEEAEKRYGEIAELGHLLSHHDYYLIESEKGEATFVAKEKIVGSVTGHLRLP